MSKRQINNMSVKKGGLHSLSAEIVPRIQRYIQDDCNKRYVDINEMAEALQTRYPEYRRKKKIPFRICVERAYEEVRHILDEELEGKRSNSEIDLAAACDESVETTRASNTESGNELIRGMYRKASENGNTAPERRNSNIDDIVIIDSEIDGLKNDTLLEKTYVRCLKNKKRKLEELSDKNAHKKQRGDVRVIRSDLTFADVGGNEEHLREVKKFIIRMIMSKQGGVTRKKGLLLHGPPGTGKTLFAHAIAGEFDLPLLEVAATELVSGVSGESEEQIRHLFEQAVGAAPCIVFIDEIDAIAKKRELIQREMECRIVSQLLTCMSDLGRTNSQVLVIGATNRPDSLDAALRRPGRFDREIYLGIPDEPSREKILKVLCRNLTVEPNLDWRFLAKNTPGYVGADLMALIGEADELAMDRNITNLEAKFEQDRLTKVTSEASATFRTINAEWISWLKEQSRTEDESNYLVNEDFQMALKRVQPSTQREGFVTVPDVTWDDIGALADIRKELYWNLISQVQHKEEYADMGLTRPSGVLLCGPPGCGKTLLAKAVANEAGMNFISVTGPELLNMYVGESEKNVRTLFERAKHSAPCVIFFDEIDALCPKRSDHGENGASDRVVNQIFTEMDGIEARKGVFLMAATNRPDRIDPAVTRQGRFDQTLYVGFPTAEERVHILRALTKGGTRPQLAEDVSLEMIGHDPRLEGYTGADLCGLITESAIRALQESFDSDSKTFKQPRNKRIHLRHLDGIIEKKRRSVSGKERQRYISMKTQEEGRVPIKSDVTFADIGGYEKSLEVVCELILDMKQPQEFAKRKMSPCKGLLLHGPPGTGKTLFAHAIAGEYELPFFEVTATELLYGDPEEQLCHLFQQAEAAAPCIVFIDEIDVIAPKRGNAQREMERRIVAQLLKCMDDLGRTNHQVLIIGATSRLCSIDTALRRPGRFDEDIALGIPDEPTREKILKVLCRNWPVDPYLDWKYLTSNTCDFVGADLMMLVHKATKVVTNRLRKKNCCDQQPLTDDQLKPLFISTEDFKQAMKCVKPSV